MNELVKGARVRHSSRPEWGVGQVLEDPSSVGVRIFFEGAEGGVKEFQPTYFAKLRVATGSEAESALLDNMLLPGPARTRPMVTMAQAKARLLEIFPGGLQGDRMRQEERTYKNELAALARSRCDAESLASLLQTGQHSEVLARAHHLVKSSLNNFPSTFEKIAFNNAVNASVRQKEFAEAFCAWVGPELPTQAAFEGLARELNHMDCAKWPILTCFRFLLHPNVDVLIKPANLAKAAELARFEINYRPELNWLTYHSVMNFYGYVRQQIADLQPRDMIDVQNFIWCIDPDQYPQ